MKPKLSNLNAAIAYQLEAMYLVEKKLMKGLPISMSKIKSAQLKEEVKKYLNSAADKRTKLKRVFGYLLSGPYKRKNLVFGEMIRQLKVVTKMSATPYIRDVMLIVFLQEVCHYKIAVYQSSLVIAEQMELAMVPDLLAEILKWEMDTSQTLSKLALSSVNHKAKDRSIPAM